MPSIRLNGAKTPIWLSDYVLADYGTGAIMCVPAHDDRDFEFAKKFDLPIVQVIAKDGVEIENMTEAYTEAAGTMINSGEWNGMESAVLKEEAPHMIEKRGIGQAYGKLQAARLGIFPSALLGRTDSDHPLSALRQLFRFLKKSCRFALPEVESYEPTGTGESPLAGYRRVGELLPVRSAELLPRRETNTMPQWAGSSWYFLRYVDSHNENELVSREKADKIPSRRYVYRRR